MSASLQSETKSPSRRALLAGALGGIGVWAASAIGRASPVHAEGETIHVGDEILTATSLTRLKNATNTAHVFSASSDAAGIGVLGSSESGYGVSAISGSYIGIYGASGSTSVAASVGFSVGNSTGVQGFSASGPGSLPAAKAKTGVYGYAAQDSTAVGVFGQNPLGDGVVGQSNAAAKSGVWGNNSGGGYGVSGSTSGADTAGVWGSNSGAGTGVRGTGGSGHGVHGTSTSGFAGYFSGKVYTTKWYELTEIATPLAPSANRARLFARVNASGKTQLCVRFQTGGVQVIKTEP
jgi:hypothetical protein